MDPLAYTYGSITSYTPHQPGDCSSLPLHRMVRTYFVLWIIIDKMDEKDRRPDVDRAASISHYSTTPSQSVSADSPLLLHLHHHLCYNVQLSGPQLVPATLTTHGHQPRPASPELSLNSIFWIYGPITSSRLHYFLYIASTQFLPTHNVQGLLPTSTTDYGSSLTQKISINSSFFGCYSTTDTCFILIIVMANYILNLVDNGG